MRDKISVIISMIAYSALFLTAVAVVVMVILGIGVLTGNSR
jgi:hypothetical protein